MTHFLPFCKSLLLDALLYAAISIYAAPQNSVLHFVGGSGFLVVTAVGPYGDGTAWKPTELNVL